MTLTRGAHINAQWSATETDRVARNFLWCGGLAGPVYLVVGYAQALTRDGFDMRRHAMSLLSNGDFGWIQIANFLISGALVVAGAIGLRRILRGTRGGTWGPRLLMGYGIGLIGAGMFVADPGLGFPPGTPAPAALSTTGILHFMFGALGFYALIAACFVFARAFGRTGERGWSLYSLVTGLGFLISFAAIASGPPSPAVMLAFYIAVSWVWIWHTAIYVVAGSRRSGLDG